MREQLAMLGTMFEMFAGGGDEDEAPRPMTPADWRRYFRWRPWLDREEFDAPPEVAQDEQAEIKGAWGDMYELLMAETRGEA